MTIFEDLAKVMADVQNVRKDGVNSQQGFNFRGIDAVVNAVGPALREHGVIVVPDVRQYDYASVEVGQKRTPMGHVKVIVGYTFHAVDGSSIVAVTPGEAMDSGDKATAKAMSVAFRTALLQALAIPTDDPDPDASAYTRSPHAEPITDDDRKRMWTGAQSRGIQDPGEFLAFIVDTIGHGVSSTKDLTADEGAAILARLHRMPAQVAVPGPAEAQIAAQARTQAESDPVSNVEAEQAEVRRLGDELRETRGTDRGSRAPAKATPAQLGRIMATFTRLGLTNREERLEYTSVVVGRKIETTTSLTKQEAGKLIDHLDDIPDEIAAAEAVSGDQIEAAVVDDPPPDQYGSE